MNELRQTIMSEVEMQASKRRFALFSQPPPLAVGDDAPFRTKRVARGEDGKPHTLPRNMLPGPNRSGVTRKSFIEPPSSVHVGDKYLDPEKVDHNYYKEFHTRAGFHELQFKPSSGLKTLAKSSYNYTEQKPLEKLKPARDDTGRVVTKDKNVTSNPMTKVQNDLFKNYKHIHDPYERKSMIQAQERAIAKQKMPPEMFRSMSHGDILFNPHKKVYGIDDSAKEIMKSKSPFIETPPFKINHEAKFKLARRGHGDALGKYPEFIIPQTTEKPEMTKSLRKEKSDKEEWKPNGNKSLTRPTPSISYSSANLRRYL